MKKLKVGFVGPLTDFDEKSVARLLVGAFDKVILKNIADTCVLVSGPKVGSIVIALARTAALFRGWSVAEVSSCQQLAGECDVLVVFGDDPQSLATAKAFPFPDKVYHYDLPTPRD